jgi:dTDP-D-glucose 4,6-dehydratase
MINLQHESLRKTVRCYLENRDWSERVRSGAYQSRIREHYGA